MLSDSSKSQTTVSLCWVRWRRISRAIWSSEAPTSLASYMTSPATRPPPPRSRPGAAGMSERPETLAAIARPPRPVPPLPSPTRPTLPSDGVADGGPAADPAEPAPRAAGLAAAAAGLLGRLVADGLVALLVRRVGVDRRRLGLARGAGHQRRVEVGDDPLARVGAERGRGQDPEHHQVDHQRDGPGRHGWPAATAASSSSPWPSPWPWLRPPAPWPRPRPRRRLRLRRRPRLRAAGGGGLAGAAASGAGRLGQRRRARRLDSDADEPGAGACRAMTFRPRPRRALGLVGRDGPRRRSLCRSGPDHGRRDSSERDFEDVEDV